MDKACTTAGSSYSDHEGCYNYLKSNVGNNLKDYCTVAVVTAGDGTTSVSGCEKVKNCTDYAKE